MQYRVGLGYDFHPFQPGGRLILGGVQIPHDRSLAGHSDADVLVHAVADALLGATGLNDIGSYFPDTDPRYRDISSLLILEKVCRLVRGKGYKVGNVDVTVVAEEPRLGPHVAAMKANLARILCLQPGHIAIKATTMEGCGAVGRKEGIAAHSVALVEHVGADPEGQ